MALVNKLRDTSESIWRFFARAPDANLSLCISIISLMYIDHPIFKAIITTSAAAWAIKQYNFDAESYRDMKKCIKENPEVSKESLQRLQRRYYRKCYAFGAKYAIREHIRENPLT